MQVGLCLTLSQTPKTGFPMRRLKYSVVLLGKKINRVACGSAHSLAWSTNKPVSAGKLPTTIPMEYNHLQSLPITTLRNRIVLLHHFSDLFCPSICMFDLQDHSGEKADATTGLDRLRGVIVSSAKVGLSLSVCL